MFRNFIKRLLDGITKENIALFGQGVLTCAKLGELNKNNLKKQLKT